MALVLSNASLEKFFGLLLKLDSATKQRLIGRLTASIQTEQSEAFDLKSFHGAWSDERSSDEIIEDIRAARNGKINTPDF